VSDTVSANTQSVTEAAGPSKEPLKRPPSEIRSDPRGCQCIGCIVQDAEMSFACHFVIPFGLRALYLLGRSILVVLVNGRDHSRCIYDGYL